MIEMTKDEWIEKALNMINVLAEYFPTHYETSDRVLLQINELNMTRFKDEI